MDVRDQIFLSELYFASADLEGLHDFALQLLATGLVLAARCPGRIEEAVPSAKQLDWAVRFASLLFDAGLAVGEQEVGGPAALLAGELPRAVRVPLRVVLTAQLDSTGVNVQGACPMLGEVVIEGAVGRLARQDDRLPGRLQTGAPSTLGYIRPWLAIPLEPHEHVTDFKTRFFDSAGHSVCSSWRGERSEGSTRLQTNQAGATPLA